MEKTRIKGNVHYVGVNDRNKHRFEAMWPLPYGVSYNSYLIDDEMVALVDTVDICYFEVYLRKIKQVIGERPIMFDLVRMGGAKEAMKAEGHIIQDYQFLYPIPKTELERINNTELLWQNTGY